MKTCFIYTTFPNRAEAKSLITKLIESGLIACANIFPETTAIYQWENKIQEQNEVAAYLKTMEDKFTAAKEFIENNHPYECPCVAKIFIDEINENYFKWLKESLS